MSEHNRSGARNEFRELTLAAVLMVLLLLV
jgi:hypothetical protein